LMSDEPEFLPEDFLVGVRDAMVISGRCMKLS
jgi:hypothetical protein